MTSYRPATRPGETAQLGDYLAVLRRRWFWPVVGLLLGLALAYLYSAMQPVVYTSTASVRVLPPVEEGSTFRPDQLVSMETEARLAQSGAVADLAVANLGVDRPPSELMSDVDASYEPESTILDISFSAPTAQSAARGADAFAEAYLAYKEREATERAAEAQQRAADQIEEYKADRRHLAAVIDTLDPDVDASEIAKLEDRRDLYNTTIQQLQIQFRTAPPTLRPAGEIVSDALVPLAPASPNPPVTMALGAFVGLFVGTLLAFARDRIDERVRGRQHLAALLDGPVLAVVPHAKMPTDGPWLATYDEPKGIAAESYRTLRTNLLAMSARHDLKSIAVTSPLPDEGKSTTSANLAVALAQGGKRVLLVSADLRAPGLSKTIGAPNTWGLVDVLRRGTPLDEVMQTTPTETLHVINTGPIPHNPAELLQSPRMRQFLDAQRSALDFVIVDCPPILGLADALSIAQVVDGVILVASDRSKQGTILESRLELDQVGARMIGAVLNDIPASKLKRRSYGYGGTPYHYERAQHDDAARPAASQGNGHRAKRPRVKASSGTPEPPGE